MNLLEKFESEKSNKTYRRVDEIHNLDWYIGYNENDEKSLVLITNGELKKYESTKFIIVKTEKRIDGKLYLSFNLSNDKYKDIFLKFCEDMIETTRNLKNISNVIEFISMRWNMWRLAFKNNAKNLSENEIKGLIGELYFLREFMVPKYGLEESINAWQGPLNYHKDYEIENYWYEVKTISDNSLTIKINSVQQLEDKAEKNGELAVIKLSNTNKENNTCITINGIIASIDNTIENMNLKRIFWSKISNLGYVYDEEYESYIYEVQALTRYNAVNKEFPKIISNELKNGIVNVSYEISIEALKKYLV